MKWTPKRFPFPFPLFSFSPLTKFCPPLSTRRFAMCTMDYVTHVISLQGWERVNDLDAYMMGIDDAPCDVDASTLDDDVDETALSQRDTNAADAVGANFSTFCNEPQRLRKCSRKSSRHLAGARASGMGQRARQPTAASATRLARQSRKHHHWAVRGKCKGRCFHITTTPHTHAHTSQFTAPPKLRRAQRRSP